MFSVMSVCHSVHRGPPLYCLWCNWSVTWDPWHAQTCSLGNPPSPSPSSLLTWGPTNPAPHRMLKLVHFVRPPPYRTSARCTPCTGCQSLGPALYRAPPLLYRVQPHASDIFWPRLDTSSNLFTWGPPSPTGGWLLKHALWASGRYASYWNDSLFIIDILVRGHVL